MKPEFEVDIKYRPDGSIDTAYHMSVGRQMRSQQAHKMMGHASRGLFSGTVGISRKFIRSIFSSPTEKLQST